ncbi:hypothetical protein Emag_004832 [Eimeria magna]
MSAQPLTPRSNIEPQKFTFGNRRTGAAGRCGILHPRCTVASVHREPNNSLAYQHIGVLRSAGDVCVTDCVVAELEKLGHRYRLALHLAKDPRIKRLRCLHEGTYADDCIVQRVTEHKCYLVATNDKDLKRRIRKIPGVPIVYLKGHRFAVERLPEAITALPAGKSSIPKA